MKKLLKTLLASLMCISLVACTDKEVEVTEYISSFIQEEKETRKILKEKEATDIEYNEDKQYFTYKIKTSKQKEYLKEKIESLDSNLEESLKDDSTTVTDITHNDDLTEFTVTVKSEEAFNKSSDGLMAIALFAYGIDYQSAASYQIDDIDVKCTIVDGETKKEISSFTYRELLASQQSQNTDE